MNKIFIGMLVLLAAVSGTTAYELMGGEVKVESATVRSSAFEAGEMVTSFSANGDVLLGSTQDSFHLIVIFDGGRERELIKVDKRTYLNVDQNVRYYFACTYGALSKDRLICQLN